MPADELVTTNSSTSEPELTAADHSEVNSLLDSVLGETLTGEPVIAPENTETPGKGTVKTATPAADKAVVQAPAKTEPAVVTPKPGEKGAPAVVPANQSKTAPAATPAAAVTPPADKPDPEVDAIQAPKNISPAKLSEGWAPLRALAKRRGEDNETLRQQLAQAQTAKPDAKVVEKLQATEAELARYRSLYITEADPEFVEKFDNKIAANDEAIITMLVKLGMTEDNAKKIRDGGGTGRIPDSYWDKAVFPTLPFTDRKKLEKLLDANINLREERKQTLDGIGKNFATFDQEQKAKKTQEFTAYTNQMIEHQNRLTEGIPWARPQTVPADATPAVKAQIEKDNAFYNRMEPVFQAALYPKDAQTRIETALSACLSYKLADDLKEREEQNAAITAENTRLQEELDAIKAAGITSRGGGALPNGGTKKKEIDPNLSDIDAISQGLDAVAGN